MYRMIHADCLFSSTEWRLNQVLQINNQQLKFTHPSSDKTASVKLKEVKEIELFSEGLCKMKPETSFTGGMPPHKCQEAVYNQFIYQLGGDCSETD